jgi:hypothetical protein
MKSALIRLAATLLYIALLGFFFAQVEIQIEGPAGWAANLPTWRIEKHWLLDIFWGGRPMTGYHAWVFTFMALVFHLPVIMCQQWSWRLELRILGALALFWIIEDGLWFVMNPAYGPQVFTTRAIPWHKHWLGPLPLDYWAFGLTGLALMFWSFYTGNREMAASSPS